MNGPDNQERAEKIAAMQRLINEARASGIAEETMADIRARVIRTLRLNG